jgi:hypothetical protein
MVSTALLVICMSNGTTSRLDAGRRDFRVNTYTAARRPGLPAPSEYLSVSGFADIRERPERGSRMIRKVVLAAALSLGLAVGGVMPSLAAATEFHTRDLQRSVGAEWSSCGTVPIGERCAFSQIQASQTFEKVGDSNGKQNCINIIQVRGSNRDHMFPDVTEFTGTGWVCGVASLNVSASLTRAELRGELPGQDCHVVQPTETTCVPTTLRIALEWRSSGDVSRSPGVLYHQSPVAPEARCLEHVLPYRSTSNAAVTGQVDGLSAPLGELTGASMGFGEVIEHGTVPFCFD